MSLSNSEATPVRGGYFDLSLVLLGFAGLFLAFLVLLPLGWLLAFSLTPYASTRPWFTSSFVWPRRAGVNGRLIVGAILFGVGWGLSGYCPGPAVANLFTGQIDTVIFVLAMLPGMWLARKL